MPAKLVVPRPSEFRDAGLRIERSALIRRGVADPNVGKDSDAWIRWESLAQQLSVIAANTQIAAEDQMPDTAEDENLTRILAIYGLDPFEAQPSAGNIVLNSSASAFVAIGATLFDGVGQFYRVETGGTYAPGAFIPIIGISTGNSTNLPQGTVLQWFGSPPAGSDPKALVAIGGLVGGVDADTNETARNRLYQYYRNPPSAGNWTQVQSWALAASPSVQAAYVYPALNGPSTLGVCVLGALAYDATNFWSRGVSDEVLDLVRAYIAARLPEGVSFIAFTPKDVGGAVPNIDTSVSIGMSLPLSTAGGGPGGGWVDAVPWPDLSGTATRVYVSAVTDSSHITLTSDDAATTPSSANLIVGETQVCWFSSAQFAAGNDPVIVATVTAVTGTTGALNVTLSSPFTGITVGDFVFPNAENVQAYAVAFVAAMGAMGPGQWTSHPYVLIRGKRRPEVTSSNPSDLGPTLLRAITNVGDEVLDVDYLYRSDTTPGIPATTTINSPNVLVPFRFGLFNRIL